MTRSLIQIIASIIIIFLVAQVLRHLVYEPIQVFIQSQTLRQSELYSEIILGKDSNQVPSSLAVPGLVAIFGVLVSLILVFLIWVYNLLALDDGEFKKFYILIFAINIFFWAYLFPEITLEPFFGQINNTFVNLIKLPIF